MILPAPCADLSVCGKGWVTWAPVLVLVRIFVLLKVELDALGGSFLTWMVLWLKQRYSIRAACSCRCLQTSDPPGMNLLLLTCGEEKEHPGCHMLTLVLLLHPYSILGYSCEVATSPWIIFSCTWFLVLHRRDGFTDITHISFPG